MKRPNINLDHKHSDNLTTVLNTILWDMKKFICLFFTHLIYLDNTFQRLHYLLCHEKH